MTNNDIRRKITPLEEAAKTARELGDEDMFQAIEKKPQDAKVEHAGARPIGSQLDSAIAKASNKNAELEKNANKWNSQKKNSTGCKPEAMETDKKVTTLRAEALAAARTHEGQKLSTRDYFEKIAKGPAAAKEPSQDEEKEGLPPIELEPSAVIKQFEDRKEDVQMGNAGQCTRTENREDIEKRWTNEETRNKKKRSSKKSWPTRRDTTVEQLRFFNTGGTDKGVEDDETPSNKKLGATQKGPSKGC